MTTEPVAVAAGCAWPVDSACLSEEFDALEDDVRDRAIAFASATLRRLTGYRVGGCPITVRPCKRSCWGSVVPLSYYDMLGSGFGISGLWPHVNGEGLWVNSCGCAQNCSCGPLCSIALPGPVGRVEQVKIDGVVQAESDYRVDDGTELVWLGSDCPFPTCQDMAAPDTADNTFSVTYLNSYPVDTLGAYAAGVMTMEFAKACSGAKCRLPATVSAVARQGVAYDIVSGSFPGGFTGIREVDAFIGLWNPRGLVSDSRVWSPDLSRPRVMG